MERCAPRRAQRPSLRGLCAHEALAYLRKAWPLEELLTLGRSEILPRSQRTFERLPKCSGCQAVRDPPLGAHMLSKQRVAKSGLIGTTLFGCLFFWLRLGGAFFSMFSVSGTRGRPRRNGVTSSTQFYKHPENVRT